MGIGIWGTSFAGRLREYRGTYVATRVFHVNLLPLFPMRTVLVLGGAASQPQRSQVGDMLRLAIGLLPGETLSVVELPVDLR